MQRLATWVAVAAVGAMASGSDLADLPPKLPLTEGQRLRVAQGVEAVTVSGETFAYHFSRRNGLIDRIEALGEVLTDGPIPDLTLAENIDRAVSPYAARYEPAGRLSVLSADPARVRLAATGQLTSPDNRPFP